MNQPAFAPRPLALVLPVWLALAAALAFAGPAQAQQPLTDASVDSLVAALRGGPATKSFRRTQLPEAGSNLCGAAPAAQSTAQPVAGGLSRNLEVVPYAGDSTPGVNLSVQFEGHPSVIAAWGRVIRPDAGTVGLPKGFGVKLLDLGEGDRSFIRTWIARASSRHG